MAFVYKTLNLIKITKICYSTLKCNSQSFLALVYHTGSAVQVVFHSGSVTSSRWSSTLVLPSELPSILVLPAINTVSITTAKTEFSTKGLLYIRHQLIFFILCSLVLSPLMTAAGHVIKSHISYSILIRGIIIAERLVIGYKKQQARFVCHKSYIVQCLKVI